jgi:hypothetical protein
MVACGLMRVLGWASKGRVVATMVVMMSANLNLFIIFPFGSQWLTFWTGGR